MGDQVREGEKTDRKREGLRGGSEEKKTSSKKEASPSFQKGKHSRRESLLNRNKK